MTEKKQVKTSDC